MALDQNELKQIIREVMVETEAERNAREAVWMQRAFDTFLVAVGIDPYQPPEMISKDLKDLRDTLHSADKWRKSVDRVQKVGLTTAVTVLVTAFLGVVWVGLTEKVKLPWH